MKWNCGCNRETIKPQWIKQTPWWKWANTRSWRTGLCQRCHSRKGSVEFGRQKSHQVQQRHDINNAITNNKNNYLDESWSKNRASLEKHRGLLLDLWEISMFFHCPRVRTDKTLHTNTVWHADGGVEGQVNVLKNLFMVKEPTRKLERTSFSFDWSY